MKSLKAIITLLFLLLFTFQFVKGQTQNSAYTAVGKGVATTFLTDYQCLGINASALGWGTGYEGKKKTMGSSEFAFGMYSEALDSKKLNNLYSSVKDNILNKKKSFDLNTQKQAIANYAEAGVSIFFDYNWAGFAYQGKRFGGIAFNIRENYQYYSKFNQQTTDLIFRGSASSYFDSLTIIAGLDTSRILNRANISPDTLKNAVLGTLSIPLNLSQLTNGSEVKMVWNRSYNLGYGRKLFSIDSIISIYGGIGGRLIQSMAMINMVSDANGIRMFSAVAPNNSIDYGAIAQSNPSNFSDVKGFLPKAMGSGYGVDLSASVLLFSKLKIALAVNNIGQVTYNRNVYQVRDTLMGSLSISGLSSMDVTQSINQLISTGGLLKLVGQEKYVLKNASDFRFGASFQPWKFLNFGIDIVAPFNKENPASIQNPVFSFGGEFRPFKWISLNAGYYAGGIYQANIPLGITFIKGNGAYEFGIASRDAYTFFTKNKHGISTALGFARFRF